MKFELLEDTKKKLNEDDEVETNERDEELVDFVANHCSTDPSTITDEQWNTMSNWEDEQVEAFKAYVENMNHDFDVAFGVADKQEYYFYPNESDLLEREGGFCFDYFNGTNIANDWYKVSTFIDWDALLYSIKVNGSYVETENGGFFNFDY